MTSVTASQLADRARASSHCRITATEARTYLEEWRERGIVEEVTPGEWALTRTGRAMFEGWDIGIDLDDDEEEAA